MRVLKECFFFIVLIFLIAWSKIGYAQYYSNTVPNLPNFDQAKYNFGFYLGANQMMFSIKTAGGFQYPRYTGKQISDLPADSASVLKIMGKPSPGFSVGLVSLLRFGKYFELRFVPGLEFGERAVDFTLLTYSDNKASTITINKSALSTYINIPFQLRYKAARIHNLRPFVYVGPAFKWDLSSQRKKEDSPQNIRLIMDKADVAIDIGTGFDIYTNYFKFGVQIEMSYGFNNILVSKNNIYTQSIDQIHSKIFQVVLTFE